MRCCGRVQLETVELRFPKSLDVAPSRVRRLAIVERLKTLLSCSAAHFRTNSNVSFPFVHLFVIFASQFASTTVAVTVTDGTRRRDMICGVQMITACHIIDYFDIYDSTSHFSARTASTTAQHFVLHLMSRLIDLRQRTN